MKKMLTLVLACICILGCVGCSLQSTQVKGKQLLREGNVTSIEVTSSLGGYNYSFSGEDVNAIMDYLSTLKLESKFKEDPNKYVGMTWIISLKYEEGDPLTIYHFGNRFIKNTDSSWYKMTYEEANRFYTLLDELNQ